VTVTRAGFLALVGALLAVASASHGAASETPAPNVAVGMPATQVAAGLSAPIYATGALRGDPLAASPPHARDPRLFILERAGVIRILDEGALRPTPFLDISAQVDTDGEGGLLGLAFDPDHPVNGLFYVYFTRDPSNTSVLSRFRVGADPNVAIAGSEEVLLEVAQPFSNHNGGTIAFSPVDGFLYLGLGDGGSANDPDERAQNGGVLLGKMLRLDVGGGPGTPYAIPPSNPFVGDPGVLDEIWALGLRNPFRFAFDSLTGDLWIGDVGQAAFEEVDFQPAASVGGENYGWDAFEGFDPKVTDVGSIDHGVLTTPEFDYPQVGGSCGAGGSGSVTGGAVYRGSLMTVHGEYFYADYCTGAISSYDPSTSVHTDQLPDLGAASGIREIVAIGEGGFGELFIVRIQTGDVHRIGPAGNECSDGVDNDGDGATDFAADTGCVDAADTSELDMDTPCDDGYDNDMDGAIDHPDDADCPSPAGSGELPGGAQVPSLSPAGYVTLSTLLALAGLGLQRRRSRS